MESTNRSPKSWGTNVLDLFERYLQAVSWHLPQAQREDIVAELGNDIRHHMDEREAELGRPLSEADVIEILKKHGHPMNVASRYLPEQYLIGPA
jgi:hypothetical protein